MLTTLRVQNFALIDALQLDFGPGLTVITGETGTGKSILMNAIAIVLGARGKTDYVRAGCDQATVEAHFELDAKGLVIQQLIDAGLQSGHELVIRRQISKSGRSRSFVNGALVTAQMLSQLTRSLVDISGQHAHYSLLRSDQHLALLDRICRLDALCQRVTDGYAALATIDARIETLTVQKRDRTDREAFLQFQLKELQEANLDDPEEEERLLVEANQLRNLDRILVLSREACGLLYNQNQSAAELVGQALRRVEELSALDPHLQPTSEDLATSLALIEESQRSVAQYGERLDHDPGRLEDIESRLATLSLLRKKYGITLGDVIDRKVALEIQLAGLSDTDELLTHELKAREKASESLLQAASQLSAARRAGGAGFSSAVERELSALGMEDARIELAFSEQTSGLHCGGKFIGPRGLESMEILMSTNQGESVGALSHIASGGELSRIMLAFKQVIANDDPVDVYIFDEVDAGVGGTTADRIAQKLKSVSLMRQALCVTHLAQIAAKADHHFRVSKDTKEGRTYTDAQMLTPNERVTELARMLGGQQESDAARAHAEELMNV